MKKKISVILLICIAIFCNVIYAVDIEKSTDTDDVTPEVVAPKQTWRVSNFGDRPPVITKRVPPYYPKASREMGIQGDVVLEVEILEDGTIGEIEVFESVQAGPGGLDEAAIETVKQWKYQPGTKEGNPVTMKIKQTISFTLQ